MAKWQVLVQRRPEKVLRKTPQDIQQRLRRAMRELEQNPRPTGCTKLVGYAEFYWIRVGDWRIVYTIEDDKLIVLIVEVAPRGSAYRRL